MSVFYKKLVNHFMNITISQSYIQSSLSPYYDSKSLCGSIADPILLNKKITVLQSAIEKCSDFIQCKFKQGISFFHLAALMDNIPVLDILCKKQLKEIPLDDLNYSPVHLRAILTNAKSLNKDKWVQKFEETCLPKSLKKYKPNLHKATPKDLYKLAHMHLPEFSNLAFKRSKEQFSDDRFTYFTTIAPNVQIDENCFKDHFHFVSHLYTDPKTLFDQWLFSKKNEDLCADCSYSSFLNQIDSNLPRLLIKENEYKNCALFTLDAIPKMRVIREFFGFFKSFSNNTNEKPISISKRSADLFTSDTGYTFCIVADTFRSAADSAQEGFPNSFLTRCANSDGFAQKSFLISAGISAGEEIKLDFGPKHPVKRKKYYISNQELQKIFQFFDDKSEKGFILTLINLNKPELKQNKNTNSIMLVNYVISTPHVLYKLATRKKDVTFGDTIKFLGQNKLLNFIANEIQSGIANLLVASKIHEAFKLIAIEKKQYDFFEEIMEYVYNQGNEFLIYDETKDELISKEKFDQFGRAIYAYVHLNSFDQLIEGVKKNLPFNELLTQFLSDFSTPPISLDASESEMNEFINSHEINDLIDKESKKYLF